MKHCVGHLSHHIVEALLGSIRLKALLQIECDILARGVARFVLSFRSWEVSESACWDIDWRGSMHTRYEKSSWTYDCVPLTQGYSSVLFICQAMRNEIDRPSTYRGGFIESVVWNFAFQRGRVASRSSWCRLTLCWKDLHGLWTVILRVFRRGDRWLRFHVHGVRRGAGRGFRTSVGIGSEHAMRFKVKAKGHSHVDDIHLLISTCESVPHGRGDASDTGENEVELAHREHPKKSYVSRNYGLGTGASGCFSYRLKLQSLWH